MDRRSFLALSTVASGAARARSTLAQEREWNGQQTVRYPDPSIVVLDPRFAKYKLGNTAVQRSTALGSG